jgi:hypothetical protein
MIASRTGFFALACLALALLVQPAAAQDDEDPREPQAPVADPSRWLALASAGVPLRLTVQEDYGQERLGASFVDLLVGYVLPGRSYRHGFGVGVSWNLSRDGGYVAPIYTADQIVIMPAYLGYVPLSRDFVFLGHLGLPIAVRGGAGPGIEFGGAFLFHLLAGAGIFAEIDLTGFAAGDASISLLASIEAGLAINYEVLP